MIFFTLNRILESLRPNINRFIPIIYFIAAVVQLEIDGVSPLGEHLTYNHYSEISKSSFKFRSQAINIDANFGMDANGIQIKLDSINVKVRYCVEHILSLFLQKIDASPAELFKI